MADYNPKTVAAYQQYASTMKAGGGGTNLSGTGAKAPPKMQTEYGNRKGLGSPTSRLDKKGYTPTTSLSTASGIEYIDNVSSEKDLPSANPAAILYSAAANANMAAGVTQTPSPLTPMNGMSLYSLKKMTEVVPQVTPYLYRVDMQEQAQDLVEQAMGYEPPLAQMTPNRQVWDYEKYSSLSSEEKDKAAEALQIVGERKMTPAEIKQFQPLIDMANEIANETITVEELAPLTQMDQEAKLKDILQVIESGGLNRITNIREVRSDNAVDPFTGLPFGGDELGFTDVSPAQEAPDQLGLMARSRVPTGSIEDAVREAYNLEEPAVEAEAPAETTETEDTTTSTDFATLTIGDTSESVAASDHLTNTFDAFEDVEGDYNHVDGRGFFTMPYGVVPDNGTVKRADGTAFNPRGSHGYTKETAGSVDTSEATHTVTVKEGNKTKSYTVKRSDYDSDEAFAKGVLGLYNREAAKKYGSGFDSLPTKAKEAAIDIAWNGGVGAVGWSSVKAALKETKKENPKTKTLFGFTVNFRSGIKYPRGLFKRRLIQYNKIANEADKAATYTTEAVMSGGVRTGTKYIANRSDGTVIGSWTYVDKEDKPNTAKNEKRVASTEKLEANVSVN